MGDRPTIGGVLLWVDEANYLRLDRGYTGKGEVTFLGRIGRQDLVIGRGQLRDTPDRVFLRLTRVGARVEALCSDDGAQWYTVGSVTFPADDPVEVGVHAIGTVGFWTLRAAHPEGTAIRFEGFEMWELSPGQGGLPRR
jgi:regulation of enolase protein 1 (concanavalin A-like superfamily)